MNATVALIAGAVALIAAALAVTRASIVHGLMLLVAAIVCLATVFFALGAGFAGALQILIYAGAILVVFVFVVMTVDDRPEALALERERLKQSWFYPVIVVLLVSAPFVLGLPGEMVAPGTPASVAARRVGALLFGPWAIAVEIASFLLLAALLGARHLARRQPSHAKRDKP
jgi:NADH-quinone oxidoreductase subunit J